ncbi:hypothetical protein MOB65_20470 [Bacillus inaquosorum]|uniref:hypothetical protein n=1 Tax=Bacillus inaquosorum TaxID=483913 RepID=UPI00227FF47D|nr:hypothetical protein [Bacillus inaquosorum]MCY7911234.1 hypothetical protein [Bacillus inaquosorum]MCY9056098.1 hypothetical protein [Bacillus spizizenii]MCY9125031.1 hypothetical protein [Bacillus spizizenii]
MSEKIIPIIENGKEKLYLTDAPLLEVAKLFENAYCYKEFSEDIRARGFTIKEYRPTIKINFDEK